MTQLESGQYPARTSVRSGIGRPPSGVAESLQAPGLIAPPPEIPQGAKVAEAIQRLILLSVPMLGNVTAQHHQLLIKEETDNAVEAFLKGQSKPEFRTKTAERFYFRLQAAKDAAGFDPETISMDPDETPGDALLRYINSTSSDLSDDYRIEYFRLILPKFVRWHGQKVQDQREQLLDEGAGGLAGRLATDSDQDALTEDLREFDKQAQAAGWTKTEFLKRTIVPAAEAAVRYGDVERAMWLAKLLVENGRPDLAAGVVEAAQVTATKTLIDRLQETMRQSQDLKPVREQISALADSNELPEAAARELIHRIDTQAKLELTARQDANENALRLAILDQVLPPEKLFAQIQQRSYLPPDDPMHLPASTAETLRNKLTNQRLIVLKKAVVRETLASNGKLPPLQSEHDQAFLEVGTESGVFESAIAGDNMVFKRIVDPLKASALFGLAHRVPTDVAQQIRFGMSAPDDGRVTEAAVNYAYIHYATPRLAAHIYDDMSTLAKIRAKFIINRLDIDHPPPADREPFTQRITALVPDAMRIQPVDYDRDQIDAIGWMKGKVQQFQKQDVFSKASEYIEDNLPEGLKDTFRFGWGKDVILPANAVNTFTDTFRSEFRIARGFGQDEEQAIETAKKHALRHMLYMHPPQLWSKEVRLSNTKGTVISPQLETAIIEDLKNSSLSEDEYEDLRDNFHYEWDERQRGYVFVRNENAQDRFGYIKDGKWTLLVVNPFITDTETKHTKSIRELAQEWERGARAIQAKRRNWTDLYPTLLVPFDKFLEWHKERFGESQRIDEDSIVNDLRTERFLEFAKEYGGLPPDWLPEPNESKPQAKTDNRAKKK